MTTIKEVAKFLVVFKLFVEIARGAPINFNNNLRELNDAKTLSFRYEVEDPETNNVQFRTENRYPNGTVTGSYGYLELSGNIHMVHYVADENGYRATIEDSLRRGALKPIPILDSNYVAYGFSREMLAALKSLENYHRQYPQDQRLRPFDQQNEEQKLQYLNEKDDKMEESNQKLSKSDGDVLMINNFDHYLGDFRGTDDEVHDDENAYDFQFFV